MKRIFLGWNTELPQAAAQKLIGYSDSIGPSIDLGKIVVIVYGKEAVRKLLLNLTLLADKQGKALLPPKIATTDYLLSRGMNKYAALMPVERKMLMVSILKKLDLMQFESLFPVPPPDPGDIKWLSRTSDHILGLIRILAEKGLTISDITLNHAEKLSNDIGRWQDLSRIENAYSAKLGELKLSDPDHAKIKAAVNPEIPSGFNKLILVGITDPMPIFFDAVAILSKHMEVETWIYADERHSGHFDNFGRPSVDYWTTAPIEIPCPENGRPAYIGPLPEQQSETAVGIISRIADSDETVTADDISVFALDGKLSPHIRTMLTRKGIDSFDPSGIPLVKTELYSLLQCILGLTETRNYQSLSALFRNMDFIRYLKAEIPGFNAETLLKSIDLFQNKYKPFSLDDIKCRLDKSTMRNNQEGKSGNESIGTALTKAMELIAAADSMPFCDYVSFIINKVCHSRNLNRSDDQIFIKSAEKINEIINSFRNCRIMAPESIDDNIFLFNECVKSEEIYIEHSGNAVRIQGWLESLWSESKYVILAGMNEKFLPTIEPQNIFLTESLKEIIGLRNNNSNFARDAYMLNAILKSREHQKSQVQSVSMITGRWDTQGDPLKPSRLLYLCDELSFIERIGYFWGNEEVPEEASGDIVPAMEQNASFKLEPSWNTIDGKLSVSSFKTFLQSPLMFYFKHVLKMKSVDDVSNELDPAEFGIVCHKAFEELIRRINREFTDKEPPLSFIKNELDNSVDHIISSTYGSSPPLSILIAVDSIKSRLSRAADIFLSDYRDGWRVLETETPFSLVISSARVRKWLGDDTISLSRDYVVNGRLDRIDRNIRTGVVRILDYKTGDSVKDPPASHFSNVRKIEIYQDISYALFDFNGNALRWIDLQFMFYFLSLKEDERFKNDTVTCAYFNLPASLDKIAISHWEGDISEYVGHAVKCIAKIILLIDTGKFGNIGRIQPWDLEEFRKLFNDDPDKHIDFKGMEEK